jgi:CBS domain-containing protein
VAAGGPVGLAEGLDEADGDAADVELSADAVLLGDEGSAGAAGLDATVGAGLGAEVWAVGVHPVTTSRADAATIMTGGVGDRFKRGTAALPHGLVDQHPIHSGAAGLMSTKEVIVRVSQLLGAKGFDVITIEPSAVVAELVALLKAHNLGAVVVSKDALHVHGIVTERDVVRHLCEGTDFLTGPVSAIMTTDVHTCGAEDSVDSLMTTMTNRRIRHLPVVDDGGALRGIVSIGDVVKSRITQLEFERDQLEGYVSN